MSHNSFATNNSNVLILVNDDTASRHFILCLVLVQHRKTENRPDMTEKNVDSPGHKAPTQTNSLGLFTHTVHGRTPHYKAYIVVLPYPVGPD